MKISRSEHDGIPVLALEGEFDSFETEEVRTGFEECFQEGKTLLVLDLGGMTFANSTTIASLITAQRRAAELGGKLILARPRDFIRKTLATLGLDTIFPLADSVDEAVSTLKSS